MKEAIKKGPEKYGSIIFETHCSNNCLFCGGVKWLSKEEKREQEETALKSLEHFKLSGYQSIDISGGDPIEYEGLLPFVKKVKKNGFHTIQLSTHGVGLNNDGFCEELIDAGINKFRIPIYGSNSKIHDSVTGNNGSFESTLSGIKAVLKNGIKIQISTLITKQNKSDIRNIMRLIDQLEVDDFYIGTPCVAQEDYPFYIPFKDLGKYLKEPYEYIIDNDKKFYFMDIPYCVFEKRNFRIIRFTQVPSLGKRKKVRHQMVEGIPFYRVQNKVSMCKDCKMNDLCSGFFKVDTDKFGTGELKPLE